MQFDMVMITSMFLVLMLSVWFNFRLGYVSGVKHAHLYGVYETVKFLMEDHALTGTNSETGKPATVEEIASQIVIEMHNRRQESGEE